MSFVHEPYTFQKRKKKAARVIFSCNGHFKNAISKQIAQAKMALYNLLQKAKILKLPLDLTVDLFDKTVLPVLTYGCEIWGFNDLKDIEI